MKFINRSREIEKIEKEKSRFCVLFGRRRVGKTALMKEVMRLNAEHTAFYYSQAIEGSESLQLQQICEDMAPLLPRIDLQTWKDFLELLARVTHKCTVIIDEFPYLVKTQSSLPSMLQRWIDHQMPQEMKLVLLGSSQTMMHAIFLKSHAPLYERANEIINVKPMKYRHFCEAKMIDPTVLDHYLLFSMVGGIPKYWEYFDEKMSLIEVADHLYFEVGSRLEDEPDRLLKDENILGEQAKYILELIGRGSNRPSEIAARMSIKQTSLSTPLELLKNASLITREVPFGESPKSTKRSLYKIYDHCLAFWYGCYSPHFVRWSHYTEAMKQKIIYDHASIAFEHDLRSLYRDGARYWEKDLEFDFVRYASGAEKIVVTEVKMGNISASERKKIEEHTRQKLNRSQLAAKYEAEIEVIDQRDGLKLLSQQSQ